jgi:hypothetical protein
MTFFTEIFYREFRFISDFFPMGTLSKILPSIYLFSLFFILVHYYLI